MQLCCVVGARPNFMKMAPVVEALRKEGETPLLVHTGQHYDEALSQVFFDQLGMPEPDIHLEVGSASHGVQTARLLTAFEEVCLQHQPRRVIVAGDVNSTVAAALVAAKLRIPVDHVEAGLRSFDRTMPEEVNRVLTDHMADLLFVTEESGIENLRREGIAGERVQLVGNCMVDTLLRHAEAAVAAEPWRQHHFEPGEYGLLTLHRPATVDDPEILGEVLGTLGEITQRFPLLWPLHPRTAKNLERADLALPDGVRPTPPLPYLDFLGLMARARCVLTDSGGIQEETTALRVPCLTLRPNTERPITVERGTNRLVGVEREAILQRVAEILGGRTVEGEIPPLWDGKAGERIAASVLQREI